MSRMLQLVVLLLLLCISSCSEGMQAAQVSQTSEGVELLRKGMEKSCDLSVRNGWVTWTDYNTPEGSLLQCQNRATNLPIYRMHADYANNGVEYVSDGALSAVNENGSVAYLQKDETYGCTRAFIDGMEVADNCHNNGTPYMLLASTSYDGESFFFTLVDEVWNPLINGFTVCPLMYQYDSELHTYQSIRTFLVRVRGNAVGYVPYQCLNYQGGRGRIASRVDPEFAMSEFGISGNFTGHFDFTKNWVAFIDNAVYPGLDEGPVYVMNQNTGVLTQRAALGYRVTLRQADDIMAIERSSDIVYIPIATGSGGSISGGREPLFDGQWLYFIAPYQEPGTEALYRMQLP